MHPETVSEPQTSFPILAKIIRSGESVVFKSPEEIPSGVAIKVLKRNYEVPLASGEVQSYLKKLATSRYF